MSWLFKNLWKIKNSIYSKSKTRAAFDGTRFSDYSAKMFLLFDFRSSILKMLRLTVRAEAAALEVSTQSPATESSDLLRAGSMKQQLYCDCRLNNHRFYKKTGAKNRFF